VTVRLDSAPTTRRSLTAGIVLGASALLLVVTNAWGERLRDSYDLKLRYPPLYARPELHFGVATIAAFLVGAALVATLPKIAERAKWNVALAVAGLGSILWTVALNATRGLSMLWSPLETRHDSLNDVAAAHDPFAFLRDFNANFDSFTTHTRGHPPGFVFVLSMLDRIGLGGARPATFVCIVVAGVGVASVMVAVKDVAGEATARATLPFLVLAPAALTIGTSADAFFAGIGAVAVACIVRAVTRTRTRTRTRGLAIAGGIGLGLTMMCTYGASLLALIPAAVATRTRRFALLGLAAGSALGVLALAYVAGFDYLDGLRLTRTEYYAGVAAERPYSYALVANIAALAVILGPATLVGLTRTRGPIVHLVGAAVVAVTLANLSGLSRLEVERIWLPFALWILPAAAYAGAGAGATMTRRWLLAQMVWALAVQVAVRTGW